MAEMLLEPELMVAEPPDITHLVTEDDTPVDNIPSENRSTSWWPVSTSRKATPGWRKWAWGLTLGEGVFEARSDQWLRWYDLTTGQIIPTGAERAEEEHRRAAEERARAERLAAQLRALGVEPEV